MDDDFEAASGVRRGPLLVFSDADGLRHAVRLSSVLAVSDLDQCRDASLLQLPGGRAVVVRAPLDHVLDWFLDVPAAAPAGRTAREASEVSLSLANLRLLASGLLRVLLDEGAVAPSAVEALRAECVAAAQASSGSGAPLRQAFGQVASRDVEELFAAAVPQTRRAG